MKTPIEALIQDFTTMRENILKQDQNQETSVVLTTLNLCITKAQDKRAEEKEIIINSFARGVNSGKIIKNEFKAYEKGIKYFKNKFES